MIAERNGSTSNALSFWSFSPGVSGRTSMLKYFRMVGSDGGLSIVFASLFRIPGRCNSAALKPVFPAS